MLDHGGIQHHDSQDRVLIASQAGDMRAAAPLHPPTASISGRHAERPMPAAGDYGTSVPLHPPWARRPGATSTSAGPVEPPCCRHATLIPAEQACPLRCGCRDAPALRRDRPTKARAWLAANEPAERVPRRRVAKKGREEGQVEREQTGPT